MHKTMLYEINGTLYRGSGWVPWTDEITVEEAVILYVNSVIEARNSRCQTHICPDRGYWVSFGANQRNSSFDRLVDEELEKRGAAPISR